MTSRLAANVGVIRHVRIAGHAEIRLGEVADAAGRHAIFADHSSYARGRGVGRKVRALAVILARLTLLQLRRRDFEAAGGGYAGEPMDPRRAKIADRRGPPSDRDRALPKSRAQVGASGWCVMTLWKGNCSY